MATIRSLSDFVAFQLAGEFRQEVYRLIDSCAVPVDLKYKSQLLDATDGIESNLAEGYRRNNTGEFSQFTRYARASLAEARVRLERGVDRKYFSDSECGEARSLGKRCDDALAALLRSLEPFRSKRRAGTGRRAHQARREQ
jgi:four helix bundle protein